MAGYEVAGGPCHWDVKFNFIVALGPKLMAKKGWVDDAGALNDEGKTNAPRHKQRGARRLKAAFDKFFNPPGEEGKLYSFPVHRPCCNFHIDAEFTTADAALDGLKEARLKAAMQGKPKQTVIQLEDIGITDHPHADIGGQVMQLPDVAEDDQGLKALPHETGHILGLSDQYKTQHNQVTPAQENEHLGHLMGKAKPGGQREVQPHEIAEIAALLGLTCDFDRCCPRQAHPVHGSEAPGPVEEPKPGEKAKSLRSEYCELGFPTGEWDASPDEP